MQKGWKMPSKDAANYENFKKSVVSPKNENRDKKKRECLRCEKLFFSENKHNRMCNNCKNVTKDYGFR